jgi:hypothetical protein
MKLDGGRIRCAQHPLLLALALSLATCASVSFADDTTQIDVDALAEQIAGLMERRSNDLIARDDVPRIFDALATFEIPTQPETKTLVAARVLPNDDFLVKSLRTRSGSAFMRRIARYQLGYDRLDRLVRMPHGRYRLQELVRGPDGHLMIAYMTTTQGGKNMGRLLSKAPTGHQFNEPTRRLYTIKDVIRFISERRS